MKEQFTTLLFTVCIGFTHAQPYIQWQKSFGGSNVDQAFAVEQTADSGYIVAGISHSNDGDVTIHHGPNSYSDYWIAKTDANGNLQWQNSFGGTFSDWLYSVQQTNDGGYILAGWTESTDGDVTGNHGGSDVWIVKTDSVGNLQWQKTYGGSYGDNASCVRQTNDGGFIIAGTTSSNDGDVTGNHGYQDFWILKTDNSGNLQWQKCYGGTQDEWAQSIQQTLDGGYIVAGQSASNDGDVTNHHGSFNTHDYWVVKTDSAGNLQWQNSFGGTLNDLPSSITQTIDSGYVVTGFSYSNDGDITNHHGSTDTTDCWVLKLNSVGTIQWQKSFGGTNDDRAYSVKQTIDGGYIVAGFSYSNDGDLTINNGLSDDWLFKTDSTGTIQWQKSFGGTDYDVAWKANSTLDGGFIVAGYSHSNDIDVTGNHGDYDYWLVKLSLTTGIADNIALNNIIIIYPNPATNKLTIKTNSNELSEFILYDIASRKLLQQKFTNSVSLNTEQLAKGIYIYEVGNKDGVCKKGKVVKD